jgi:prepilin-type N-terminal cleavage/methylation domain-containing protein
LRLATFYRRTPVPRRRGLPRGDNHGFTLVEMMIALVLFGVGMMALAQVLPRGLSVRDKARRMSVASSMAQEEVERLRNLPFAHADLAAGNHADPDNPIANAFRRQWTVQDNTPVDDMKRLTVTVSFPTDSADSQAVVTTMIARGLR